MHEITRTAVGGSPCRLFDGEPWFCVQVTTARAGMLVVSLELGGDYNGHIIEGVPAVATPSISISGGGDIVRIDVRFSAFKAEFAFVETVARIVFFAIVA